MLRRLYRSLIRCALLSLVLGSFPPAAGATAAPSQRRTPVAASAPQAPTAAQLAAPADAPETEPAASPPRAALESRLAPVAIDTPQAVLSAPASLFVPISAGRIATMPLLQSQPPERPALVYRMSFEPFD